MATQRIHQARFNGAWTGLRVIIEAKKNCNPTCHCESSLETVQLFITADPCELAIGGASVIGVRISLDQDNHQHVAKMPPSSDRPERSIKCCLREDSRNTAHRAKLEADAS